jgi:predicted metalloprotease
MSVGRGTGMGLGGVLVLLVLSMLFGQDFLSLVAARPGNTSTPFPQEMSAPGTASAAEEELVDFVSFVLEDLHATWAQQFQQLGGTYRPARLVLFRDAIRSACGFAQAASGPFYCPADQKVYVDLAFFEELKRRFGAPGDFAQAYVLAHEIGHHVQTLLGIEAQVRDAQRSQPRQRNQLSVSMELQADCFAGVWGRSAAQRDRLDQGDVEEGLNAAAAIGDDRIQRQSSGYVNPESFTHGSSQQRVSWFRQGLTRGDVNQCDTFGR